jgi:hypothetical protein
MSRLDEVRARLKKYAKEYPEAGNEQWDDLTFIAYAIDDLKYLIARIEKLHEVLAHADAAMTYAYEDHGDQYYLNVQAQIRELVSVHNQ